ncbi:exonuclease, subunit C [Gottschalkia purinilytica]|uniref:Nuclease SbcCD subunit C n=1 Tax=Gottschalkia purinilytica TaxID=1503 RepID=A0A0L0WD64_GOTPU|nr:SbcC/MukB-like Walker B domain-containing protein [Gottschalkia purinilytica]KNF09407.1 exonuclease, subunit C [Gottschalkia purinilytica]
MRPINLKIKGLNSFLQEEEIDFSKLVEKGLFGIFGPTGSGKSTILDAITLAIYGQVARKSTSYINTETDKLYISFEFKAGNGKNRKKYKIERSIKRKKDGGISTVFAKLITYNNLGEEENIVEKTTEVRKEIENNIIGLNFEDFIKTVVLPQGKFSEFLTLAGAERNRMLERILGLEEYGEKLSQKIKVRKDLVNEELRILNGELNRYEGVSVENIKILKEEQKNLLEEEEKLKQQITILNEKYEKYKRVWELQQQLALHEVKHEKLIENKENIEDKKTILQKGRNALAVIPYIHSLEKNNRDISESKRLLEKYKESLRDLTVQTKNKEDEYKVFYDKKENDIPLCRDKKREVEEAIKLEEEKNDLEAERKILMQKQENTKSKINSLSLKLEEIRTNKKHIESEMQKREEYISKRTISSEYRTKIIEGSRLEEKYIEILKDIKESSISKENILVQIENLEKDKRILEEELSNKNNEIKKLDSRKKELENSKPDNNDIIFILRENIFEITNKIKECKEINLKVNDLKNIKLELDKNINENNEKLKVLNKDLKSKENSLESLKKDIKDLEYKNLANILSKELKEGNECPVCGSTTHPKLADIVDNSEIEEKQQIQVRLEKAINDLRNNINKIEIEVSSLKKDSENKESEIKELSKRILGLNEEELKREKNSLEERLKKSQAYLEKWNTENEKIENELKVKTEEKYKLENKETGYITKLENHIKNKNELEEKLKILEEEHEIILDKYIKIKEELSLKNIKEKLEEVTNIDKELEKINKTLREQKENVKKLEQDKDETELNINNYKDEMVKIEQSINSKEEIVQRNNKKIEEVSKGKDLKELKVKIERYVENVLNKENRLKLELEGLQDKLNKLKEEISGVEKTIFTLENNLKDIEEKLEVALRENNFKNVEEVKENSIERIKLEALEKEIKAYEEELNILTSNIEKIKIQLEGRKITKEEWESLVENREEKNNYNNEIQEKKGQVREKINEMSKNLDRVKEIQKEIKKLETKNDSLEEMFDLTKGKKFVEYISRSHLKLIAKIATSKLKEITRERYGLEISEDNNFIIIDNYNGGVKRECNSLSGGETFLVSLSLALALSTKIQLKGNTSIEFFFLDEGFGTLDTTTLDVAMTSLEKLHREKLSVGIISHVEELKNRVPVKLLVSPPIPGVCGSRVKVEYS